MACAGLLPGPLGWVEGTGDYPQGVLPSTWDGGNLVSELETDSLLALMVGRKPFPQEVLGPRDLMGCIPGNLARGQGRLTPWIKKV